MCRPDGQPGTATASLAAEVLARCEVIAGYSEEPGKITRTFLCGPMRGVHERLGGWMRAAGMAVRLDPVGNLIGRHPAAPLTPPPPTSEGGGGGVRGADEGAPVFLIGSHLDSVPDAG